MPDWWGIPPGLLVVDLTRVLAGPFCTMSWPTGARVINVEHPQGVDDSPLLAIRSGQSVLLRSLHRGNESIALEPQVLCGSLRGFLNWSSRPILLVENFRPRHTGPSGPVLRSVTFLPSSPHLRGPCPGFVQTVPWGHKPAYDLIVQALGGMK